MCSRASNCSSDALEAEIPAEWLKKLAEKYLTEEEKKQIEAMGGLDKLLETLNKRLAEQKGRHQGGSKWIGTAGTSPFGAYGYNPEGVRIGQDESTQSPRREGLGQARVQGPRRRGRARHPQHQDRAAPAAQVRPHRRARGARSRRHHQGHRAQGLSRHPDAAGAAQRGEGAAVLRHRRLDGLAHQGDRGTVLGGAQPSSSTWSISTSTIACTRKCGRRTAAASRRTTPTWDVLHTYPHDYKVVFVGDASMSPYEITAPGGSVEHFNDEPGAMWLERVTRTYPAASGSTRCRRRNGITPIRSHDAPADGRADVSADAGRARSGDAGVGEVRGLAPFRIASAPLY